MARFHPVGVVIDTRVGAAFRAVRLRLSWRQRDLATKARVSTWLVRRIESGRLDGVRVGNLRRVGDALGIAVSVRAEWRGADLDRLLNARHSALHEDFARRLAALPGWVFEPEVSFAVFRERGIVDILAWHARRAALLLIELKTSVVDVQEMVGTFDRKRRLAREIAASRGWRPTVVGAWLIIADTATNRRRVQGHRAMLRAAFPADGRRMRSWLRDPDVDVRALGFWSETHSNAPYRGNVGRRRVRPRKAERGTDA